MLGLAHSVPLSKELAAGENGSWPLALEAAMCIGRFLGIRIRCNWLFVVLLFLLAWVGLLPEAIIVFGIVVIHELAHVIVARSYGLRVTELEILPFGGVAHIDDLIEVDPDVEKRVALAGPVANLFLIAGGLVCKTYEISPERWLDFFVHMNIALAGFNALPALPLDGGRVYREYLTRKLGFKRATEKAARLGKIFGVAIAIGGLVGAYFGYVNLSSSLLGFFLYDAAAREQKKALYVLIRYLARKQDELRRSGCLNSEQLVAAEHTKVADVVRLFVPQRYHLIWVVDEQGRIEGLITELDIVNTLFEQGSDTPVRFVLERAIDTAQGP